MVSIGFKFTYDGAEYVVAEKLNEGGFAIVYKATGTKSYGSFTLPVAPLAVKVLKPLWASNDEIERRFRRECDILANLDHASIVKIRTTLDDGQGGVVLVQDYIHGAHKINEYVATNTGDETLLSLALQVLYALRSAHDQPVLRTKALFSSSPPPVQGDKRPTFHRDLTSSNVLVTPDGKATVIDFGLAVRIPRAVASGYTAGVQFGTPGFKSPEQEVDPASVDARGDLYSLGRILTHCLQPGRPTTHLDPSLLPEPWRTFCTKLTAFRREDRYQTAEEAITALLGLANVQGLVLRDPDLHFEELWEWTTAPREWAQAANIHLRTAVLNLASVACANRLSTEMLAHGVIDMDAIGRRLVNEVIDPLFINSRTSYGSCDPLATLMGRWFLAFQPDLQDHVMLRLTRIAVDYNRYHVMDIIRAILARVTNGGSGGGAGGAARAAHLRAIVKGADTGSVIRV